MFNLKPYPKIILTKHIYIYNFLMVYYCNWSLYLKIYALTTHEIGSIKSDFTLLSVPMSDKGNINLVIVFIRRCVLVFSQRILKYNTNYM